MTEPASDDALFIPDGDRYVPTTLARGPWNREALHGGPVAALAARAIEGHEPAGPTLLSRLTVELLRPVPLAPLAVSVETLRPGRKVQLVGVSIRAEETEVARAVGLRSRTTTLDLPFSLSTRPHAVPDATDVPDTWPWSGFHNDGAEMRWETGHFSQPGPGRVWMRLSHPVVAGEEPSSVVAAAALADFGNGVSSLLPPDAWRFINPELTVHLIRKPDGPWLLLDSTSYLASTGTGMAETALSDISGPVGRAAQALLVEQV
jgi:hypothetical protein